MNALGLHQLSFYLLTNAVAQPKLREELISAFFLTVDHFEDAVDAASKNIRVGYASLILNLAVYAYLNGNVGTPSNKRKVEFLKF